METKEEGAETEDETSGHPVSFFLSFHILRYINSGKQSSCSLFPRGVGNDLSSRLVAKQVFSAQQSLTSVFGMGTGGPSALKSPTRRKFCSRLF